MGDTKNKTAAVVVTWNRKEMLRQCLDCLLKQKGASCDILVIDNDSDDGTGEMIADNYSSSRVFYFNTGSNLGGAGGFMCGIEAAVEMGYDRVWIMDDDCYPDETALDKLLEADERLGGDWGFLCSAIYWVDGKICQFNRPKKDVFRHVGRADYGHELVPVVMTSFVSVMFRADVVRDVGLPIAEYFIWTDDYEFTGRVSGKYPSYVVPSSKVTHAMKVNSRPSLATEEVARIRRFYYLTRNDMHCYRQHGFSGYLYLAVKAAYTSADVLMHAKNNRAKRLAELMNGTIDGLTFNPVTPKINELTTCIEKHTSGINYRRCSGVDDVKIAIISTQTTRIIPYIKLYINALVEQGQRYDLIYWDRHGYYDDDDHANCIYRYRFSHESDSAKLEGIRGYVGFSRFATNVVARNKYEKLIILQVQTGVAICPLLMTSYRRAYILDIRDYSYERYAVYKAIERRIIKTSYKTVISSPGFRSFLPEHNYIEVHNMPTTLPLLMDKKEPEEPIIITYSGCIHYYSQNIKLIDLFANDERFIFRFIGEGAEVLKDYVEYKSAGNIVIMGAFKPEEERAIYESTDVISNAYGNDNPLLNYALANKFYLALAYKKPILVSEGTYSAKLATDIGIGIVVDFDDVSFKDKLREFVMDFRYDEIARACNNAMSEFRRENDLFLDIVKNFASRPKID